MIRRFDAWLGKTLFHPPIILVCQLTGWNQFVIYRFLWMVVALHALWIDDHKLLIFTGWLVLFALTRVLSAGLSPDRPAASTMPVRMMFAGLLAFDVVTQPFMPNLGARNLNTLIALFAEYAATITTIPPRENREPKRKLARAEG